MTSHHFRKLESPNKFSNRRHTNCLAITGDRKSQLTVDPRVSLPRPDTRMVNISLTNSVEGLPYFTAKMSIRLRSYRAKSESSTR